MRSFFIINFGVKWRKNNISLGKKDVLLLLLFGVDKGQLRDGLRKLCPCLLFREKTILQRCTFCWHASRIKKSPLLLVTGVQKLLNTATSPSVLIFVVLKKLATQSDWRLPKFRLHGGFTQWAMRFLLFLAQGPGRMNREDAMTQPRSGWPCAIFRKAVVNVGSAPH